MAVVISRISRIFFFVFSDIIHAGQVLVRASNLSSYLLQSHSTVYVVKKFSSYCGNQQRPHPGKKYDERKMEIYNQLTVFANHSFHSFSQNLSKQIFHNISLLLISLISNSFKFLSKLLGQRKGS